MLSSMISIVDRLVMEDDASLFLHHGEIIVDDDLFFSGDSLVTVNDGLLQAADKLRFDDDPLTNGLLSINGGIVYTNEFGDGTTIDGVVEINGPGIYQVELLSVTKAAIALSRLQPP
jgi:hypothetical protein